MEQGGLAGDSEFINGVGNLGIGPVSGFFLLVTAADIAFGLKVNRGSRSSLSSSCGDEGRAFLISRSGGSLPLAPTRQKPPVLRYPLCGETPQRPSSSLKPSTWCGLLLQPHQVEGFYVSGRPYGSFVFRPYEIFLLSRLLVALWSQNPPLPIPNPPLGSLVKLLGF